MNDGLPPGFEVILTTLEKMRAEQAVAMNAMRDWISTRLAEQVSKETFNAYKAVQAEKLEEQKDALRLEKRERADADREASDDRDRIREEADRRERERKAAQRSMTAKLWSIVGGVAATICGGAILFWLHL